MVRCGWVNAHAAWRVSYAANRLRAEGGSIYRRSGAILLSVASRLFGRVDAMEPTGARRLCPGPPDLRDLRRTSRIATLRPEDLRTIESHFLNRGLDILHRVVPNRDAVLIHLPFPILNIRIPSLNQLFDSADINISIMSVLFES